MAKNRIKLTGPSLRSRGDAEMALAEVRNLTITRTRMIADREEAVKAIDEKVGPILQETEERLQGLTEQLRAWSEANPDEFKGKKSLDLIHGTLGWRIGNPTLKTLSGFTWDRVLERLKAGWTRFVRVKEEVDKAAILSERESLTGEQLRDMGVKVVQGEAFFIEPKLEDTDNRQLLKEAA